MSRLIAILALLMVMAAQARADFVVEEKGSHVGFASVKNGNIAEVHKFTGISGGIDSGGNAMVAIILSTVETQIPIRNERMRTMLLDVGRYPLATIRSKVELRSFTSLDIGESRSQEIDLNISVHGMDVDKKAMVKVTRSSASGYDISSLGPIMIHASEFDMMDGIEALRDIAGLQSILPMVPVTFDLHMSRI